MKRLRTFIAINLPAETKNQISAIVDELSSIAPRSLDFKWINPRQAHITLVFLGNISEQRVLDAAQILENVVQKFRQFTIETGSLSYFYKGKDSNESVVYLDIPDKDNFLKEIYKELFNGLATEDFYPPTRYQPHITLGKLGKINRDQNRGDILAKITDLEVPKLSFKVEGIGIYESSSQGRTGGHTYSPIRIFRLQ